MGLLDPQWQDYLSRYSDVRTNDYYSQNPWLHYERYGQAEGRTLQTPAPSTPAQTQAPPQDWNAQQYLLDNPDVASNEYYAKNPLLHYTRYGEKEGRLGEGMMSGPSNYSIPPAGNEGSDQIPETGSYTGGGASGTTPPNNAPLGWNPQQYLRNNPDVKAAGFDPLNHYLKYGKTENRTWDFQEPPETDKNYTAPKGWDPKIYLAENPDLAGNTWAQKNPLAHYALFGMDEGRQWGTGGYANTDYKEAGGIYLGMYPDVQDSGYTPWEHYQKYGKKEGREWKGDEYGDKSYLLYTDKDFKPGETWDAEGFLKMHPELKDNEWAQKNPLAYVALFGEEMKDPTFTQATPRNYKVDGEDRYGVPDVKVLSSQLSEDGTTRRNFLSDGTYLDNWWDPSNEGILGVEDRGDFWFIYTTDGKYTGAKKDEGGGGFWGQATKVLQQPARWALKAGSYLAGGGNNDFERMDQKLQRNEDMNSWGATLNAAIDPTQTTGLFAAGTGRALPNEMKTGAIPQTIEAIAGYVYPVVGPMAVSGLVSQFNEENPDEAWTKAGMKGATSYVSGKLGGQISSTFDVSPAVGNAVGNAIVTTGVQKGIYNQSWEDSISAGIKSGALNYVSGKLIGKFEDAYGNTIRIGGDGKPFIEKSGEQFIGDNPQAPQPYANEMLSTQPLSSQISSGLTNATSSAPDPAYSGFGGAQWGGGSSFGNMGDGLSYSSPLSNPGYQSPLDASKYWNPTDIYGQPTSGPFNTMADLYYQNNMPANIGATLRGQGFEGMTGWDGSPNGPPLEFAPPMDEFPGYRIGGNDPLGINAFFGGYTGMGNGGVQQFSPGELTYGSGSLAIPGYESPLAGTMFGPGGGIFSGYPGFQNQTPGNANSPITKKEIKAILKALGPILGGTGGPNGPGGPGPGGGEGGPKGGLLSLDDMPIPEYMKRKLQRKARSEGKTWQEYVADATRNQKAYYSHLA